MIACGACAGITLADDLPSLDVIAGKALFERNWVSAPASTAASDGLGPFFNARSCVACHPAGLRGEGPASLSIFIGDLVYGEFLQTRAVQGLRAEGRIKLDFSAEITHLADGTEVVMHTPRYEVYDLRYGTMQQSPSARLPPSLRGLGLLERVSETHLLSLADPADEDGDGVSGRISKVKEKGSAELAIGRFGWKAETASLHTQVARALSLDMGLGTSVFPSPFGDCTASQADCLGQASGNSPAVHDPEVSDTIVQLMLTYLQSLAPEGNPALAAANSNGKDGTNAGAGLVTAAANAGDSAAIPMAGGALFEKTGCSACHRPAMPAGAGMIHPYTDLLLHDLGPGLAAGSSTSAEASEWRTAPLWGLSSARVYLHDGRATTLTEAIMWHGGEADSAVDAYSKLPAAQRDVLHTWLHGL